MIDPEDRKEGWEQKMLEKLAFSSVTEPVSYTHLTLPTTPYV